MELKLITCGITVAPSSSINRTFMELKHDETAAKSAADQYQSNLYGIETSLPSLDAAKLLRINRTFMELKLGPLYSGFFAPCRINRTFMELKLGRLVVVARALLYQSNLYGIETIFGHHLFELFSVYQSNLYGIETLSACLLVWLVIRINRTFMELKQSRKMGM